MIRHRKNNNDGIIYTTDNSYNNINEISDECSDEFYETNINEKMKVQSSALQVQIIDEIDYNNIETLVFSSTEMYTLSILGYIDKLMITNKINISNIKNYVSSSLGTIIILYLSFKYTPKEIIQIFYDNLSFVNSNIFNIVNTFGIFEIKHFINKLLEPLYNKLGYIPTLKEIYNLTNIQCVFIGYNFTKNKIIIYNYKTFPNIKVDEVIQKCCIIPFLFKKYLNEETEIDIEDIYIDYSLIDNKEYEYAIKIFNKSKILLLKTNVIYDEENIDINNISIFEYAKNLFETIQNREDEIINFSYDSNIINNIINIEIKKYNKTLVFDEYVKYKEFLNLYCNGFNFNQKNNNNNDRQFKCKNEDINITSEYTGIVIAGGGTNVFNLVGGIKYCMDNNIIDINSIDTFIGTSAGSFVCTMLALNFKIEDVIDVYVNDISKKLNFNIKNLYITEILNQKSIYPNKLLIESYEIMFIKYRDGNIPTLLDIKNNHGKNIIYTVFNVTKNRLEYLNYENSPDLLVTQACAMSSCIPFAFNPIEYKKCFYIDGGIKSNYSIEVINNYNKKFIGFGLTFLSNYSRMNLFEFLFYFIFENSRKYQVTKIKKATNCDSYSMCIVYDDDREGESLLVVTKNIINKYMDSGYKFMLNKLKK
jgi:predicted acylesterase/phospholipase RssA